MCIWVQEAMVCQVSVPLFTCLPSQVSAEKTPAGQGWGEIPDFGSEGLEVGFTGFYTEQGCWAGLSPGQ